MKRVIKFRAKRIDMDRWVYGDYFRTPLTDENSKADPSTGFFFLTGENRHCIRHEHGVSFVIDEKTLGQYSGVLDKNGKEICEGDIPSSKDGTPLSPVYIENGCFMWKGAPLCYDFDSSYSSDGDTVVVATFIKTEEWAEIIGNIHDNPELLSLN